MSSWLRYHHGFGVIMAYVISCTFIEKCLRNNSMRRLFFLGQTTYVAVLCVSAPCTHLGLGLLGMLSSVCVIYFPQIKMLRLLVLALTCAVCLVNSQIPSFGGCPTIKTQESLDIQRVSDHRVDQMTSTIVIPILGNKGRLPLILPDMILRTSNCFTLVTLRVNWERETGRHTYRQTDKQTNR